jgi:hypothetical protein
MGCLFGCREAHQRRASTQRSVAYYRADPEKKSRQNAKRRGREASQVQAAVDSGQGSGSCLGPGTSAKPGPMSGGGRCHDDGPMLLCPSALAAALPKAADRKLMEHIRVVLSLMEERPVSLEEIWEMMVRVLRQHTMVRRRKIDHTLIWLNEEPP